VRHEAFDRALHQHLLVLRSNIIAHHDSEYLSAKLLLAWVTLSIGAEAPIGVSVHVQSLYSIEHQAIAHKYAAHFDAAIECIDAALESDLRAYLQAGHQHPAVF
jgi:hypothetical protein